MSNNFKKTSVCSLVSSNIVNLIKLHLFVLTLSAFIFALPPTFQPTVAALDTNFNAGVTSGDSVIYVTKPLPDGKILVGGSFTTVNSLPQFYLARLNSDGSTDTTFNSGNFGPNGSVFEITVLADNKIIIGGSFTSYNGVSKSGIVRLNSNGSLDSTFNPNGTGATGTVRNIAVQSDGKILFAGTVTVYNDSQQFSVYRLNVDGTRDTTFTSPFPNRFSTVVEVDIQTNGKILVGGVFSLSNGQNVSRLNQDGSPDSTFGTTGFVGDIYAMQILADGKILIGGNMGVSGQPFPHPSIRRLNSDGSTDNTFAASAAILYNVTEDFALLPGGNFFAAGTYSSEDSTILPLLKLNSDGSTNGVFRIPIANNTGYNVSIQADERILLSGEFSQINGQQKSNIVRLNGDGMIDNSFNATFEDKAFVYSLIQQNDGKIIAAGDFNLANGAARSNIARFNADGTLDNSFNSGTGLIPDFATGGRFIYDTEIQPDGKILLAGFFNGYNGTLRRGIVRLNTDGTVDTSFQSDLNGGILIVYEILVLPDGNILASTFGTDPLTGFGYFGVVKLNSSGISEGFAQPEGTVRKMARQPDGKILIGGGFSNVNVTPLRNIARFNANGSVDPTFNIGSGFNGGVLDIVVQPDGKILVAGTFTSFNGTPRNRIARLNSDGSLDSTFDPGSGADATVYKIGLLPSSKIVLGGNFNNLNDTSRLRLGILNSNGSVDFSFESGFDNDSSNTIRSLLVQSDGNLVVGGFFSSYNRVQRNSLARLIITQPNTAPFDFDGDRRTDISIFRPSNGQWWYSRSSDGQVSALQFGDESSQIVPADYTGDGKTDVAVFRVATGEWLILRSDDNSFYSFPLGRAGDLPQPADYDGDGKADAAIYRPSSATWFINKSSGGTIIEQFGTDGDIPEVADYDGDGRADIAIYRPSNGQWWIKRSNSGVIAMTFGGENRDTPVQADYTGDGKADVAFWRPSTGELFVLRSEDLSTLTTRFGLMGDIPAPGDYDGDGKADFAVFRPTDSNWYINRSTSGFLVQQFGLSTDQPVPSAFLP
jgi:uncharacterized delta-60 repeat protein